MRTAGSQEEQRPLLLPISPSPWGVATRKGLGLFKSATAEMPFKVATGGRALQITLSAEISTSNANSTEA